MKSSSVTIQMKATERYFPVVLFIMLYKVVLTFESVDGIRLVVPVQGNVISCTFLLWCLFFDIL